MFAGWAERGSGDGGDSGIVQQNAADLFGAAAGTANIDPGVERAFGSFAAEARHFVQIVHELFAARANSATMRGVLPSRSRRASMAAYWVNSATQV